MTNIIEMSAPARPAKLMSPDERRIRIQVFAWGTVKHPAGDFEVDSEFYRKMKTAFDARQKPAPILRQHKEDGLIYGKIAAMGCDERGIYVDAELSPQAYEWWEGGLIADWSPGLLMRAEDHHTGEEFENVLRELSFVSIGHLANTQNPSPAYSLEDAGSPQKEGQMEDEKKMQEEGMAPDLLADLVEQVGELREALAAVQKYIAEQKGEEVAEDEAPAEGEMAEVPAPDVEEIDMEKDGEYSMADRAMAKRVAVLEAKLKAADERAAKAEAAKALDGIKMGDKERGVLLQLACDQPEAFRATVATMRRNLSESAPQAPRRNAYSQYLGESGSVGNVEAGRNLAAKIEKDARKLASADGATYLGVVKQLTKTHRIDMGDAEQAQIVSDVMDVVFG